MIIQVKVTVSVKTVLITRNRPQVLEKITTLSYVSYLEEFFFLLEKENMNIYIYIYIIVEPFLKEFINLLSTKNEFFQTCFLFF